MPYFIDDIKSRIAKVKIEEIPVGGIEI